MLTLHKNLNLAASGGITLIGTGKIVTNGYMLRAPTLQGPLAPHSDLSSVSLISGTDSGATSVTFATGSTGAFAALLQMSFSSGTSGQHSSVLHLQGTDGVAQVLQLSYDPTGLSLDDQQHLFLAWLNGSGQWVNSVLGNHTLPNPIQMSSPWLGDWASYAATQPDKMVGDLLGAFGVDTTNHIVWAAIDHNSQFVVMAVPEPSAIALLTAGAVLGGCSLVCRRRAGLRKLPHAG